jgi:hypothetical protein
LLTALTFSTDKNMTMRGLKARPLHALLVGYTMLLAQYCVLDTSERQDIVYIKPCNFVVCLDYKYHSCSLIVLSESRPTVCVTRPLVL